jgi:hypothetical protein
MMSGAIKVSRRMRLRYESLTFSALASSAEEEYSPLSSICRQRWARTTALTSAPSTRGAGDHGAVPGGDMKKAHGNADQRRTPIFANMGFSCLSAGRHAASCWVMELPVNSPRSEVTPSIRSLISTRSVWTDIGWSQLQMASQPKAASVLPADVGGVFSYFCLGAVS